MTARSIGKWAPCCLLEGEGVGDDARTCAVVFKESFKVQNVLVHQRASSPNRSEHATFRGLRTGGLCSLIGEGSDILIVVIWCCGVCSCVCVIVIVIVSPIERRCSDLMTEISIYEAGEKLCFHDRGRLFGKQHLLTVSLSMTPSASHLLSSSETRPVFGTQCARATASTLF